MRRGHRKDANQNPIMRALEGIGVQCVDTSALPEFVDFVGAYRGGLALFEVKDGDKPPSARKLTPAQIELHAKLRLAGVRVYVVENESQALAVYGARMAA